jgi:hypothetical protein
MYYFKLPYRERFAAQTNLPRLHSFLQGRAHPAQVKSQRTPGRLNVASATRIVRIVLAAQANGMRCQDVLDDN